MANFGLDSLRITIEFSKYFPEKTLKTNKLNVVREYHYITKIFINLSMF